MAINHRISILYCVDAQVQEAYIDHLLYVFIDIYVHLSFTYL